MSLLSILILTKLFFRLILVVFFFCFFWDALYYWVLKGGVSKGRG